MTVEINAPDRGAYENFERHIKFDDNNKYARFTADRIEEKNDKFYLKSGEWYRAILLKTGGEWFIRPVTTEEGAKIDVKISKKDANKILDEFQ